MEKAKKQHKTQKLRAKTKKVRRDDDAEDRPLISNDAPVDSARIVKELGDNVDTRQIADVEDLDDDIDEFGYEKIIQAQQETGTRHKDVAHEVPFSDEKRPDVSSFIGHNRYTVTTVCVSQLPVGAKGTSRTVIFFGDKSGCVFRCQSKMDKGYTEARGDLATAGSLYTKTLLEPKQPDGVCSLAVSDTTGAMGNTGAERTSADLTIKSYLVCGNFDGTMCVWNTQTSQHVGNLKMHSGPVTGLDFRLQTHTCYSVSTDGCLRVWSIPEMHAIDKFYGHVGTITCISALKKERCVTGGSDRTVRYWKLEAATQFDFAEQQTSVDCVAMIDDNLMVGGNADGTLSIFDVARRGPLDQIPYAHGYGCIGDGTGMEKEGILHSLKEQVASTVSAEEKPRHKWLGNSITAVAAVPFSDLVASGSYDGTVKLWRIKGHSQVARKNPTAPLPMSYKVGIQHVTTFEVEGFVNSLRFTANGEQLVIGLGKEGKMGRWITLGSALNGCSVLPLMPKAIKTTTDALKNLPAAKTAVPLAKKAASLASVAATPMSAKKSPAVKKTPDLAAKIAKSPVLKQLSPKLAERVAKSAPEHVELPSTVLPQEFSEDEGGDDEENGDYFNEPISDSDFDNDDEAHPMMMEGGDEFGDDLGDEEDIFATGEDGQLKWSTPVAKKKASPLKKKAKSVDAASPTPKKKLGKTPAKTPGSVKKKKSMSAVPETPKSAKKKLVKKSATPQGGSSKKKVRKSV